LSRSRKEVLQAIEDLTWIANNWPETQLRQILTVKTVIPLINSILHPNTGIWNPEGDPHLSKHKSQNEIKRMIEEWKPRRQRIAEITKHIVSEELPDLASTLAPEAYEWWLREKMVAGREFALKALAIGR